MTRFVENLKSATALSIVPLVVWPIPFWLLSKVDESRGMTWLVLHHAYYAPFAALAKAPFFEVDSHLSFVVLLPGRLATPLTYVAVIFRPKRLGRKITGPGKTHLSEENRPGRSAW